jgi:hypothetical protein
MQAVAWSAALAEALYATRSEVQSLLDAHARIARLRLVAPGSLPAGELPQLAMAVVGLQRAAGLPHLELVSFVSGEAGATQQTITQAASPAGQCSALGAAACRLRAAAVRHVHARR